MPRARKESFAAGAQVRYRAFIVRFRAGYAEAVLDLPPHGGLTITTGYGTLLKFRRLDMITQLKGGTTFDLHIRATRRSGLAASGLIV